MWLAVGAAIGSVLISLTVAAVVFLRDDGSSPPKASQPDALRDPPVVFASLPAGYRIENLVTGLSSPTALDGPRDGRIFVAEQFSGQVRVIEDGRLLPEPFFIIDDLYLQPHRGFVSELGFVGLTVDPDESDGLKLYLYYSAQTADGARSTKLVRVREAGGKGVDPSTILEIAGAPDCCHIAGGLTWLPDGTLLVGVGDHEDPDSAQDLSRLNGSVLRINRDGSAPPDNPFVGDPDADPRIFALGLRNPFGIAADSRGPMYVLDNGESGFDTVYQLRAGANYGWPSSVVPKGVAVQAPIHTYLESTGLASAVLYHGRLSALDGVLLFCQFHQFGALHWFEPRPTDVIQDRVLSTSCSSGIRQLPDEYLYFLDYITGSLMRISDGAS